MKACRLHSIGDFRCDEVEKPSPKGKELLIKISSCGLCGSDIPRIYKHGSSSNKYPLTIGHEFGGTVVEVGPDADQSLLGKCGAVFPLIPCNKCEQCKEHYYVMCEDYDYMGSRRDGGFAEYCLVPSDWHFIPAPQNMDGSAFGLIEPCTVAQHAVRSAITQGAKSLVIFGAGPIGIMAARWAQIFAIEKVMLVDVVDEKVNFAIEKGVHCVNSTTTDINDEWLAYTGLNFADAVIEGTGFSDPFCSAINLCKPHGKIVLMGNPAGDTLIKQKFHSLILRKELNICGIWNSYYKGIDIDEWEYSVEAIAKGKMQVVDLITHKVSLEDLPNLCDDIYNKKASICKAVFCQE